MAEYKLTKEDYKNLEALSKISQEILKLNNQLCELEIDNKKESGFYQSLIGKLKELIDIEQEIYEEISDNPRRITAMLFYIMNFQDYDISEVLQLINNMPCGGKIQARMAGKLERLLRTLKFDDDYEMADEVFEDFDYEELSEIEDPEELEKQFFYSEKLGVETERDILNTILKILKEYIEKEENHPIKRKLIQFKYRLSFLFQTIEQDFLKNGFEISPYLFWGAGAIVDLNNGKQEELDLLRNGYAEDILYNQEENLMNVKFEDFNSTERYYNAVIAQIIIRACLLFVDEERRTGFKNLFLSEYKFGSDEILDGIVNGTFNAFEQDRELPSILSFRLK